MHVIVDMAVTLASETAVSMSVAKMMVLALVGAVLLAVTAVPYAWHHACGLRV
jgi:hypothetical protein